MNGRAEPDGQFTSALRMFREFALNPSTAVFEIYGQAPRARVSHETAEMTQNAQTGDVRPPQCEFGYAE